MWINTAMRARFGSRRYTRAPALAHTTDLQCRQISIRAQAPSSKTTAVRKLLAKLGAQGTTRSRSALWQQIRVPDPCPWLLLQLRFLPA